MNIILYNGFIYSMEDEKRIYEAIAIKNNKIFSVSNNDIILKLKTNNTNLIDLQGKHVFPGFNDSHMHLLGYGYSLSQVNLTAAKSIEDIISITKEYIKNNTLKNNTWVLGYGWNQDNFKNSIIPNNNNLDKISKNHYIFLKRACGHIGCSNTKVLDDFNISTDKTLIDGGVYYNGIFKENAMELINKHIPKPDISDIKKWIIKGANDLISYGITSVQSDDLCVFSEDLSNNIFKALNELSKENKLPIRVYEQSLFRTKDNLKKYITNGYKQNSGNLFFKNGPLKILGDGSLGARTAYLKNTYNDDNSTSGISMYTQEELNDYILEAQKNNISTAIHCIGDQMLEFALNSFEFAQTKYPNKSLRNGIVHCQITSKDQLKRMKELNIMAYVQPIFLDYDIHIVNNRVGKKLASTSYNWKTMMDLNLRISFGSDTPVDSPDPIKGIHCAVTRKDLNSKPYNGYLLSQKIKTYDAIYNYTVESAFASYDEHIKGKLLPNYLADCIVLNNNIFKSILDTSVELTILNGKIVYQK